MKTRFIHLLAILLIGACLPVTAANDIAKPVQFGLFEEEANHDLTAAIKAYQVAIGQFDSQRQLAATAIFRVGECYRKLGKINEAAPYYERIVREFGDQTNLVALSRQYVPTGAGATKTGTIFPSISEEEAKELQRVQALVKNSPDTIQEAEGGFTPLQKAAQAGQLVVAEFLLANGANVNSSGGKDNETPRGNDTGTPLYLAASSGNKAMVELLLRYHADIERANSSGETPLHIAAKNGYRLVVDTLLARGAKVNAGTQSGWTPLSVAAAENQNQVAEALLAHGATIDQKTTAHYALMKSKEGVVHKIAEFEPNSTPLHLAARVGAEELVELLCAKGANVNSKDATDGTPLLLAVQSRSVKTVQILLSHGAGVNAVGKDGRSPLGAAVSEQETEIVELLLDHQADPNLGSGPPLVHGMPPYVSDIKIVSALLSHGANPNVKNDRMTLLQEGASAGNRAAVELLLKFKADVDAVGYGASPLAIAVTRRDPEMVEMLLANHANPNAGERPPLALALSDNDQMADERIVSSLLKHGANPNVIIDQYGGETALQHAASNGDKATVDNLLEFKADIDGQNKEGKTALDLLEDMNQRSAGRPQNPIERIPGPPGNVPSLNYTVNYTVSYTDPNSSGAPPKASNSSEAKPAERSPARITELIELLKKRGAKENVYRRMFISAILPGTKGIRHIFYRGTNSLNRYSLTEFVAEMFSDYSVLQGGNWPIPFPDFSSLQINRLDPTSGKSKEIRVDLESAILSNNPSEVVWLEWGDAIEIPMVDHKTDQRWDGPTLQFNHALHLRLARMVKLSVKGETQRFLITPFGVSPANESDPQIPHSGPYYSISTSDFRLWNLLRSSKMLRASSDLSRVKVARIDQENKDRKEYVFNEEGTLDPRNDLWLRDGDEIFVPEKPSTNTP
jgi:ankyrin repeat protein